MDRQTSHHQAYLALMADMCAPQPLAFRWFCQILDAALLWDHVVDGDCIDKGKAGAAIQAMTTEWVNNEWYHYHRAALTPVLVNCVSAWQHANISRDSEIKGFDLYTELPSTMAYLIRGQEGVDSYVPKIRAVMEAERAFNKRKDHPPFLIMGLPRSRTAWLACFLTDGPVHCHHELIRQCEKIEEYPTKLLATTAPIVGDSSPSLPLIYDRVKDKIGTHKLAFIRRNAREAEMAHYRVLSEAGLEADKYQTEFPKVVKELERLCDLNMGCPSFDYADLDDAGAVAELTVYCTGQPFNHERFTLFHEQKITALASKVISNQRIIK